MRFYRNWQVTIQWRIVTPTNRPIKERDADQTKCNFLLWRVANYCNKGEFADCQLQQFLHIQPTTTLSHVGLYLVTQSLPVKLLVNPFDSGKFYICQTGKFFPNTNIRREDEKSGTEVRNSFVPLFVCLRRFLIRRHIVIHSVSQR